MKKIHELITPINWIKGAWARTDKHRSIGVDTPGACAYCLGGWIAAVYNNGETSQLDQNPVFKRVAYAVGVLPGSLPCWNDNPKTTYEKVLALCRKLDI